MKRLFFNKALRILLISNGIILLAGAMLGPIYALFVEKIGGNLLDASIAGGLFALAAGITTLTAGKYADKNKRNDRIVATGYAVMGFGFLSYIFVDNIWLLFIIQSIIGFSEAFYSPAFDALYSKHITPKKAGIEWSAWESINYFSIAAGAIIGGFIVTNFGFNALFIIIATLCFSSSAYIFHLNKNIL